MMPSDFDKPFFLTAYGSDKLLGILLSKKPNGSKGHQILARYSDLLVEVSAGISGELERALGGRIRGQEMPRLLMWQAIHTIIINPEGT